MKLASLVSALFLSLALLSCQAPTAPRIDGSSLTFRPEVSKGVVNAIAYHGPDESWQPVWFGAERSFALSYVGKTYDGKGNIAIAFDIAPHDEALFSDFTESLINKHMAILIDGEIMSAPIVNDRLPGSGLLSGGPEGFAEEEATALITALRIGPRKEDA